MRTPRGYVSPHRNRGGRTVMRSRWALLAVVTGGAVFLLLLTLVASGQADGVDEAVARLVQRHHTTAGGDLARAVTDVLSPGVDAVILVCGAALLAWHRRRWRPLLVAMLVLATVATVVLAVKYAVDRPLPHSHGRPDAGFPSGHAAATGAFLGVLALLVAGGRPRRRHRLLVVASALAVAVSVALVYAGYHWLTDTLASLALGAAVIGAV